jgi:hypothetical protein
MSARIKMVSSTMPPNPACLPCMSASGGARAPNRYLPNQRKLDISFSLQTMTGLADQGPLQHQVIPLPDCATDFHVLTSVVDAV